MSLRRHLVSIRSSIKDEEGLTAGEYSEMAKLRRIALELKKSPSLSVLLPRHDKNEEFWRIVNISDDYVDIKVNIFLILLLTFILLIRIC